MSLNANWPVMDYAVCWAAGPAQTPVQDLWCSVAERTEGTVAVTRGKQYELDQCQPGEMTFSLRNDDGAFDPKNGASPYAGYVKPYRLVRLRAQWSPTQNLFTADQATAGKASSLPVGVTLPPFVTASAGGSPQTIAAGGVNKYQVSVASGTAIAARWFRFAGASVSPGLPHTITCLAAGDASGAVQGQLVIQWYNAAGALLSSVLGTAKVLNTSTVTLTVSGTAPAGAAGMIVLFQNSNSPGSNATALCWNLQLEKAAAATAFTQPGTWYSIFVGYVERFPQSWTSGGNYGTVDLVAVDQFAHLAGRNLRDVLEADILAMNPNFLYKLNEASGATQFADASNNRGPATILVPTATTIKPGSSIASGDNAPPGDPDAMTGGFLGSAGPVTSFLTYTPGLYQPYYGATIALPPNPATGLVGPPKTGGFTRVILARATGYPPNALQYYMWCYLGPNTVLNNGMGVLADNSSGTLKAEAEISAPVPFPTSHGLGGATALTDTDWHMYGVSIDAGDTTLKAWIDGGSVPTSHANSRPPSAPPGSGFDVIGALAEAGGATAQFVGDLAYYFELPFEMDVATWASLYRSWRNAWSTTPDHTETSDARYSRILTWLGYAGPTRISAGVAVSYGPATDIQGGTSPTAGLAALQAVVDSEGGQHFIANDGTVVFQSRYDRVNKTATVTFGENAGEVPYLDAVMDFDPTRVGNDVQVTQQYGNAVFRQIDSGSQNDFGEISLPRTVNSIDPAELLGTAEFLLYQNREPLERLEALPVDLASNPALWPTLLGVDLGTCATVNRRPSNAPASSLTGFVEQVVWSFGDDLSASWTGQVSSGDLHQFGQFDSAVYGLFDSTLIFGY